MRPLVFPVTALLLLAAASPALASAGLPKIASVTVGEHSVAIHDDSLSAKTGPNTFTVEVADLPVGHSIHLKMVGPQGQVVTVPLQDLTVLQGPDEEHGDMAGMADMPGMTGTPSGHSMENMPGMDNMPGMSGHDMSGGGHGSASSAHGSAPDGHGSAPGDQGSTADAHGTAHTAGQGYSARGKAVLDAAGTWRAVVEIQGDHAGSMTAEVPFDVHRGGPAPMYLGFTGLMMGGFLTYGIVKRRNPLSGGR